MNEVYDVLGISKNASQNEIESAYKEIIKKNKNEDLIDEIEEAYKVLSDEENRNNYDNMQTKSKMLELYYCRALEYFDKNELEKAIETIEEASIHFPDVYDLNYLHASILITIGKYKKAKKIFRMILKEYPNDVYCLNGVGDSCLFLKQYKKALESYKKAYELEPDNLVALLGNARALLELEKYEDSLKFTDLGIERSKEEPNYLVDFLITRLELYIHIDAIDENRFLCDIDSIIENSKKYDKDMLKVSIVELFEGLLSKEYNKIGIKLLEKNENLFSSKEEKEMHKRMKKFAINKEYIMPEFLDFIKKHEKSNEISELIFDYVRLEIGLRIDDLAEIDTDIEIDKLSMELDLLEDSKKYRKDLIFIKRHYPNIYLELEDFFSLLMSEVQSKKAYDEYLEKLMNNKELMEQLMGSDIYEEEEITKTFVKDKPDIGRNDPCPCGSGKKYKKCCMNK